MRDKQEMDDGLDDRRKAERRKSQDEIIAGQERRTAKRRVGERRQSPRS